MYISWGTRNKTWNVTVNGEPHQLVLSYGYFALLFIFSVTHSKKWFLLGEKRSEDKELSHEELKRIFPNEKLDPSWWENYSLFAGITIIILLGFIGVFN